MKRLAAVCMLICCLSFPVFGGHHQAGDRWCDCDNPQHGLSGLTVENEADSKHDSAPELGLFLLVLTMLMLRYRD